MAKNVIGVSRMKKYLHVFAGFLAGIIFASAITTYAAANDLIGKKVVSEVKIVFNDSEIEERGAVIEGTSFLPVRTIANLFGIKIDYRNGVVYLESTDQLMLEQSTHDQPTQIQPEQTGADSSYASEYEWMDEFTYDGYKRAYVRLSEKIEEAQKTLDEYRKLLDENPDNQSFKQTVETLQKNIAEMEAQKAEIESMIKGYEQSHRN